VFEAGVRIRRVVVLCAASKRANVAGAATETMRSLKIFYALDRNFHDCLRGFVPRSEPLKRPWAASRAMVARLAEDDAFAGGEAVGFDDEGGMERAMASSSSWRAPQTSSIGVWGSDGAS